MDTPILPEIARPLSSFSLPFKVSAGNVLLGGSSSFVEAAGVMLSLIFPGAATGT